MFGGSAQLLVIGLVGSGAGLWAAVAAAVVFNARLLVFSATLTPVWKGTSVPRRLIAAAVVVDPVWALTSRRVDQGGAAPAHRLYFAGTASLLVLAWPVAMGVGVVLGGSVPVGSWTAASLLPMSGAACLAAVIGPHLRTSSGARAILAAVVVGWVGRDWPAGSGLLVAMAAAGLAGAGLRPRRGI